jgi:hypothetical protein
MQPVQENVSLYYGAIYRAMRDGGQEDLFSVVIDIINTTKRKSSKRINATICKILGQTETYTFDKFFRDMATKDDTWKFWALFMALLFTAFDHKSYQKLMSQHTLDILNLPSEVLLMFTQGVVNITGREWHSVGIDEAHKMLINKNCRKAVV